MSSKRDFPHPVLGSGNDYPDCGFQAALSVEQRQDAFVLDVGFDVGSNSIEGLIRKGRAEYVLHVHCPRTAFRRAFRSKKAAFEVEIAEPLLRDTFNVTPQIISKEDFEYESSEFAQMFSGMKFSMRPGYVLAIGQTVEYPADKDVDDLNRLGSIFQIVRNRRVGAELIEHDFEHPKIVIQLPDAQFSRFELYRKRKPYAELFVTSLILPALALALDYMKTMRINEMSEADISENLPRWQRALEKRLSDLGAPEWEPGESFTLAQRMLENPMLRAFLAIDDRESREES